jgi:DNA ligase-1
MSRDYVGDMAETVSLLWPGPEGEACALDDGTIRISDAVDRLRLASRRDAPAVLAPCSIISTRRAVRAAKAGHRRASRRHFARLAKQALADAFGLDVEQVEEVWHGLKPPYRELFAWGEGRAAQPTRQDCPVFRPFMLAHPLESARLARRLCRRVEMGRDPRPAGPCRRPDPALQPHRRRHLGSFPDIAAAFASRACSTANCWFAARPGARRMAARRSFNALQQRLGARMSAPRCRPVSGLRPALRHSVRRREDLRALPWSERRRAWRLHAAARPDRFDLSQLIEAASFERWRRCALGVATRASRA